MMNLQYHHVLRHGGQGVRPWPESRLQPLPAAPAPHGTRERHHHPIASIKRGRETHGGGKVDTASLRPVPTPALDEVPYHQQLYLHMHLFMSVHVCSRHARRDRGKAGDPSVLMEFNQQDVFRGHCGDCPDDVGRDNPWDFPARELRSPVPVEVSPPLLLLAPLPCQYAALHDALRCD